MEEEAICQTWRQYHAGQGVMAADKPWPAANEANARNRRLTPLSGGGSNAGKVAPVAQLIQRE
jgi:hypothetical protein